MLPNTPDRVPSHTSAAVNRRIQHDTAESVRWHARHPERIDQHLRKAAMLALCVQCLRHEIGVALHAVVVVSQAAV